MYIFIKSVLEVPNDTGYADIYNSFHFAYFSRDWLSTTTQAIHWRVLVDGRSETIILWTTMRTTMTMPRCLRGKVLLRTFSTFTHFRI